MTFKEFYGFGAERTVAYADYASPPNILEVPETQMTPTFCLKGHYIGFEDDPPQASWREIQFREHYLESDQKKLPPFCITCGAPNIDSCQHCGKPLYNDQDLALPLYCGYCSKPLPWTVSGLASADSLTDELDGISQEEKAQLKASYPDLTRTSATTPLALSRVKRTLAKVAPSLRSFIFDALKMIATSEVKKYLGL